MPDKTEAALAKKSPDMAITNQGFAPATMEEAWSYACRLAKTQFIPDTYRDKPDDCFIAIDIAQRLGVDPLMYLHNSYVVYGRPALYAQLVSALVNKSGLYVDPLDYEVVGGDPHHEDYKVRAYATSASTGTVLYGPWITWKLVKGEAWDTKKGSKWPTMPEQMFHYRAASWFCNRHCPEVKMGFMTVDEAQEVGDRKTVESTTIPKTAGRHSFGKKNKTAEESSPQGTAAKPAEDTTDVVKEPTEGQAGEGDKTEERTEGQETDQSSDPTTQDPAGSETNKDSSTTSEPPYTCTKCNTSDKIEMKKTSKGVVPFCMTCVSGKSVVENK